MHKSKVIELMKYFETKDYRLFDDFINSPYFNKNEDVTRLYKIIGKHNPKFISRKLEKEKVWKELFKNKKFNEKKLGYLQTDLVRLIEKYIVQIRLQENDILSYTQQLKTYQKISSTNLFQQTLKKAYNHLNQHPFHDSAYYFDNYLISEMANIHFEKQATRKFNENLQIAADNLDLYYLSLKLKYTCEMINRQNIMAGDYKLQLVDEIISFLDKTEETIPAIDIYFSILILLTEPDREEMYLSLKQLLKEHEHLFPIGELKDMYAYARNYCIKKVNSGNPEYLKELIDLYKITLENKVLFNKNTLSHFSYINIVKAGVKQKDYKWTQAIIEKYKTELEEEYQESAYAFSIATLNYEKKDYREALFNLHQVEFNDVYYALGSKLLLLKIYYELDDIDPLLSLIESFKIYLKRNKLVDNGSKTRYNNLLSFLAKSLKVPDGEKEKLNKLLDKVRETKKVTSIAWLIDIIESKLR